MAFTKVSNLFYFQAEILRLQSISLSDVPASSTATQRLVRDSTDDEFSPPFSPSTSDFEARKLKDEIKQLRAECQHWKQLVKRDQDEVRKLIAFLGDALLLTCIFAFQSQKSTGGDETGRLRAQVMVSVWIWQGSPWRMAPNVDRPCL